MKSCRIDRKALLSSEYVIINHLTSLTPEKFAEDRNRSFGAKRVCRPIEPQQVPIIPTI